MKDRVDRQDGDIAIIGMAGLYPGADDVSVFWSNILNKRDCVTDSPDGWMGDGRAEATLADLDRALALYRRACVLQFLLVVALVWASRW